MYIFLYICIVNAIIMWNLPAIFNPSNDMALAAGVREYTPPKRIQQMEDDLRTLAEVWKDGPWGWSMATKHRYEKMGIDRRLLPTDEWLAEVRRLSSREYACGYIRELLSEFRSDLLLGGEMEFCTTLPQQSEGKIFKSLWSSSGRGVFTADGLSRALLNERLSALISAHGGYVADRFYDNKQQDCALEFLLDGEGECEFVGYSVFAADRNGTYQYNYVESQEQLIQRIGIDRELLESLVDYHKAHLCQTHYKGYVGIDMLTTADGRLHPVVEMNFRMNMGVLAIMLYERYGAHATVELTPRLEHGFQCSIANGKLNITVSSKL